MSCAVGAAQCPGRRCGWWPGGVGGKAPAGYVRRVAGGSTAPMGKWASGAGGEGAEAGAAAGGAAAGGGRGEGGGAPSHRAAAEVRVALAVAVAVAAVVRGVAAGVGCGVGESSHVKVRRLPQMVGVRPGLARSLASCGGKRAGGVVGVAVAAVACGVGGWYKLAASISIGGMGGRGGGRHAAGTVALGVLGGGAASAILAASVVVFAAGASVDEPGGSPPCG